MRDMMHTYVIAESLGPPFLPVLSAFTADVTKGTDAVNKKPSIVSDFRFLSSRPGLPLSWYYLLLDTSKVGDTLPTRVGVLPSFICPYSICMNADHRVIIAMIMRAHVGRI